MLCRLLWIDPLFAKQFYFNTSGVSEGGEYGLGEHGRGQKTDRMVWLF